MACWVPTLSVLELTDPVQISIVMLTAAGTLLALCIDGLQTPRQ